jgi:hypothetical protein
MFLGLTNNEYTVLSGILERITTQEHKIKLLKLKWFNIAPNSFNSNAILLEPYTKRLIIYEIEQISSFDLQWFHRDVINGLS